MRAVLLCALLTTTAAAGAAPLDEVPDVRLRFTTDPRGATIFCPTMPAGRRFLGRADGGRTAPLPQGRHRFLFALPGYRLEDKLFDCTRDDVHRHVRMVKVAQPSAVRPFLVTVRSIGVDESGRRALIHYRGTDYHVEVGWSSPDGAFDVVDLHDDRMRIRNLRDGATYWFTP